MGLLVGLARSDNGNIGGRRDLRGLLRIGNIGLICLIVSFYHW